MLGRVLRRCGGGPRSHPRLRLLLDPHLGACSNSGTWRPTLTFGSVSLGGGIASFSVAGVSWACSYTYFRFNLRVGSPFGTVQAVGASGTAVPIDVGDMTYFVSYRDLGGDGTVNAGDQFSVWDMQPGAPYTFVLLWSDGSQIQSVNWYTP